MFNDIDGDDGVMIMKVMLTEAEKNALEMLTNLSWLAAQAEINLLFPTF
jgi:hypothetical protein